MKAMESAESQKGGCRKTATSLIPPSRHLSVMGGWPGLLSSLASQTRWVPLIRADASEESKAGPSACCEMLLNFVGQRNEFAAPTRSNVDLY